MKSEINIDELMRKAVKEKGIEIPASGFSDKVMYSIHQISQPSAYRPLIPRYTLISILSAIVLLIIFFLLSGKLSGAVSPFPESIAKYIPDLRWNFSLPGYLAYSIEGVLIILLIQAVLIGKIYRKIFRLH